MKKITTLMIASSLLWLGDIKAQFNTDWAEPFSHTTSANFSNEGRKVAVDSVSGFIYTLYDVTSDLNPNGVVTGLTYSYTILAQYDLAGSLVQSQTINVGQHAATGYDLKSGFGLEIDNAGYVYIGYMSYDASTSYDINLAKYDNALVEIWSYTFNPVTEDLGIAMKVSNIGNAFAILKSVGAGNTRHRIIKANTSGISATALYTYSAQPDYLADLEVDASQKVYTTGYRLVNGVKNILISCVNGAGTLLWSRIDDCGTNTGDDFARDIHFGYDGDLYITGSSQGTVQHGIDAVVMKFNPVNGKKIWESFINFNLTDGGYFVINPEPDFLYVSWLAGNTVYVDQLLAADGLQIRRVNYTPFPATSYNGLSGASLADMKISKYKNVYLTGSILGVSSGQSFSASYLVRINFTSRGLPQVEYALTVSGDPAQSLRGVAIAFDEDNNQVYLLEDQFQSFASHQQEAALLFSFDLLGGLRVMPNGSSTEPFSLSIHTYPNPANNELFISTNSTINKVEVSDVTGKVVLMENVNGVSGFSIDVSELPGGVYNVKIYDSNGFSVNSKMMKGSSK